MPFLVPLILIAWPIAEIAAFIVVGGKIGVLWTIGLIFAASVLGGILLRIQGFGAVNRIRREMDTGKVPGRDLAHGAMIMLAGLLLILPGFVSDIVGLLLFLPPVRDLAWRLLRGRITIITDFRGFGGDGVRRGGRQIDLGEGEYSRSGEPDSPWRRIDKH